jgi:hypothetical protein
MMPEYLVFSFESVGEDTVHPEPEFGGQADINDPRLSQELQSDDPEADAYTTHAAVKIMIDTSGEPASVAVRWS